MRKPILTICKNLILIIFLLCVSTAGAKKLTLTWDANSEANLNGYRLYWGNASGRYSNFVDVGNVTTYTLTSLQDRQTYYLAVTAYSIDPSLTESNFSNEVMVRVSTTIGLYDPMAGVFHLKLNNSSGNADIIYRYGPVGADWEPLVGDWNGDGVDTIGLYDPLTGIFYLNNKHSGGSADITPFRFGPANSDWIPLAGDWNGDRRDSVGLYDRLTGTFYLKNTHSGGSADIAPFRFGPANGDWIPLAGDWNGNRKDSVGLYAPHSGKFYLKNAHSSGAADSQFRYGPTNAAWKWEPLVGDWNGNGKDTVGLYHYDSGHFYLRKNNTSGIADIRFKYGPANLFWWPLAGKW